MVLFYPKEFKQMIVVLYNDSLIKEKYPGAYILLNTCDEILGSI